MVGDDDDDDRGGGDIRLVSCSKFTLHLILGRELTELESLVLKSLFYDEMW